MPVNFDANRINSESDAQWGRPLLDGKYPGIVTWVEDPAKTKNKATGRMEPVPGEVKVTFTVTGNKHTAPDGAVKMDWRMGTDWRAKQYAEAMGYDTSKNFNLDPRQDKGKRCTLVVATSDKDQKAYIKKLLPLEQDSGAPPKANAKPAAAKPAQSAPAQSAPAQSAPASDNPF